jgi:hypothetical protein
MSISWNPLVLSPPRPEIPPLLISTTFTANSYTIYVTDLANIWSESLLQKAIIRRSEDEETSIDPRDDDQQLKQLLDHIQLGLTGGKDTSLSLASRKARSRSDSGGLDFHIIATLPKGLKPLRWPIHLETMSQTTLTAQLTIPLVRAQNSRLKELEGLMSILKDKDHVIQKLVDKLEASGADLAHVFAGAAGKNGKVLPRDQAEQRVKGLKSFDLKEWKGDAKRREESAEMDNLALVLEELFDAGIGFKLGNTVTSDVPGQEDWWEKLVSVSINLSESRHVDPKLHSEVKSSSRKDADMEDEESGFQVQATPPRGGDRGTDTNERESSTRFGRNAVIDGSTDDEDDLDAPSEAQFGRDKVINDSTDDENDLDMPSQRSLVPDSVPISQPANQSRRFGKIGGNKPASKASPRLKSLQPVVDNSAEDPLSGDETASEDEAAPAKALSPPEQTTPPPAPKPKKIGLGTIGGKKKEAPTVTEPPVETSIPDRKATKHKLGVIGHKVVEDIKEDEVDRVSRGRSETKNEGGPSPPRETSTERADRRREESKRELAEKSRAPPKKKRRF